MLDAEQTEQEIDTTRSKYIPVAVRTQLLFFCTTDLSNIDPMYQYSLEWFIGIFLNAIASAEKSGKQELTFFVYMLSTSCLSLKDVFDVMRQKIGGEGGFDFYQLFHFLPLRLIPLFFCLFVCLLYAFYILICPFSPHTHTHAHTHTTTQNHTDDLQERIAHINDYFTFSLYSNVCRSLFEKHKLLFSFLLCVRILMNENKINMVRLVGGGRGRKEGIGRKGRNHGMGKEEEGG